MNLTTAQLDRACGALYAMRRTSISAGEAITAMERALPEADPADAFRDALERAARVKPGSSIRADGGI